jgi:hypothetical protein
MAKKKIAKPETKSDFLRKALGKNPDLSYEQILRRWDKAGREGSISAGLYYQVRSKMGIRTVWQWMPAEQARPTANRGRSSGSRPRKSDGPIYQLKITLKDIRPPIWRRILVADVSLEELHEIIQVAMGWENYHLYDFAFGSTRYTDPRGMEDLDMEDASRARLGTLVKEKSRFTYTYDFGDDWRHEILVEKILPADTSREVPSCVDGKRACPPEDCGGPWGYGDFVEAIGDPGNERHEELREWAGDFDPEAFDLGTINAVLRSFR